MGRFDAQDQVMSAQVVTATAVSEDAKDLTAAGIDISVGRRMGYLILPRNDAGGDVVATSYLFEAIQATDSALTAGVVVVGSTGAIAGTSVLEGKPIALDIRQGVIAPLRYQGVRTTVTGGTNPTVTLDAYLVPTDEIPFNAYFNKVSKPTLS